MIHRSCVCRRNLHNYTLMSGDGTERLLDKTCCRCLEDCLCHGGSECHSTRKAPVRPLRRLKPNPRTNPGVSGEGDS